MREAEREGRPLVTVVTPFRDPSPRFFAEAIESVLGQTYPRWELLLVDDGAAEESGDLARRYAAGHPGRIRCLEHEGRGWRGHSASRNLGIRDARGSYVAFLDADDVWFPHKLAEQVELLESRPEAGMVYGNTLYWYGWTGRPEDRRRDFTPELGVPAGALVPPPRLLPRFLAGQAAVPCTCSVVVRREVVERVGAFEASFTGLYEDQAFYAKVCCHFPVLVSGARWDRYRQHPDSLSAAAGPVQESEGRRAYLMWLEGYLRESRIGDREVWGAIRRELWKLDHPVAARVLRSAGRWARRARRPWSSPGAA